MCDRIMNTKETMNLHEDYRVPIRNSNFHEAKNDEKKKHNKNHFSFDVALKRERNNSKNHFYGQLHSFKRWRFNFKHILFYNFVVYSMHKLIHANKKK